MLLWIAILLLIDASGALWFESQLARAMPRVNVRWLAFGEALLGLLLVWWHFNRH